MRRLWLLLVAVGCANVLAQTPIPIEHFTRFDSFDGMKISPDGRSVAVLSGEQGRSQLAFIDLDDKKAVGGVRSRGYVKIDTYRWTDANRLIYTLQSNSPSRAEPLGHCSIYAINRDGTARREIYAGVEAEVLRTYGKHPQTLVVAEYPLRYRSPFFALVNREARARVNRIDVDVDVRNYVGGRVDTSPVNGGRLLLDRDDNVRFALGSNENLWPTVGWRPDPDGEWQVFDLEDFHRDGVAPVDFGADNRSVLLTGVRRGESFEALYRLDLPARRATKVFGFDDANVEEIIRDFADREIVGVRGYTEQTVEHWLVPDHPVAKAYAVLHRAFPGQRVRITSASADGRRAIVFVDSDVNPGDYYLFDTTQQRADFLRAARTWIDPRHMRPKQPITLVTRDGLQLHGYVTQPTGDGPTPLVVLPHDGLWSNRRRWEFDWEVQLLASRGYAVLQVNYRGSDGYGNEFEDAGDGEWGGKIQNDITDATRWAIAQGIARADRICVFGRSYGGYAALMSVVREPKLFRCAIGYGAVYDLTNESRRPSLTHREATRLERVLGTDVEKLRSRSPLHNVRSIEAPVLLIHGKHDSEVDYGQFKRMKRALQREQKTNMEFMTLPREASTAHDEQTRREVYERILQFLDTNLNARPGTP